MTLSSKNLRAAILGVGLVVAGVTAFVLTSNAGGGACTTQASGSCTAKATQTAGGCCASKATATQASNGSCSSVHATQASMDGCTGQATQASMGSCTARGTQASMGDCCGAKGAKMQTSYEGAAMLGASGSCSAHGMTAGMCSAKGASAGNCSAMGASAGSCTSMGASGASAGSCSAKGASAGSCASMGASAGSCGGATMTMTASELFPAGTEVTRVEVPGGVDMIFTSGNLDAVYTTISQRVGGCKTECAGKGDCGATCAVSRTGGSVVLSMRGPNAANCCAGKMGAGLMHASLITQ